MTSEAQPTRTDYGVPFPALTPAQRYHLEVFGYVIVPDVLTRDECEETLEDLRRLRADLNAIDDPDKRVIEQAYFATNQPHHQYLGAISQARSYPAILKYVSHPRVVGMAEELIGGRCHIVESNAHLNRKAPDWPTAPDGGPAFGFHRGIAVAEANVEKHGLTHSGFVKVLTNLTDLGPEDGGTVVVAGSHRIDAPEKDIIAAAYDDRRLIHQVVAPAGSSLLFTEALIHATGRITSDKERGIIIAGYATTYFPWQFMDSHRPDFEFEQAFIDIIPESARHLYISKGYIQRQARYRTLAEPVDDREYPRPQWPAPQPEPARSAT